MSTGCNGNMTATAVTPRPSSAAHALVASANSAVRAQFLRDCKSFDGDVEEASGGADALAKLESGTCRVLFLDQYLPDLDADELRQIIRDRFPSTEVVMLDSLSMKDEVCLAHPTFGKWLEKSRDGKPLEPVITEHQVPLEAVETDFDSNETGNSPPAPTGAMDFPVPLESRQPSGRAADWRNAPLPGMVGESPAMRRVYRLTRLVASHSVSVLIIGDTGTGKELVARAVHELSRRAGGPFLVVNCAAIPETLLESELFGYARGAFTGALQSFAGRIQGAQRGTLFLDEVGEMSIALQAKLLRFLDRREIQRLGTSETLHVDVRLVAATNRNLEAMVAAGDFRADLYYRLAAFPLELPSLAERREDIVPLAHAFLASMAPDSRGVTALSPEAEQSLIAHTWGGNVRELQQVLERAVILAEGESQIGIEHLYFGLSRKRGTQLRPAAKPQSF